MNDNLIPEPKVQLPNRCLSCDRIIWPEENNDSGRCDDCCQTDEYKFFNE